MSDVSYGIGGMRRSAFGDGDKPGLLREIADNAYLNLTPQALMRVGEELYPFEDNFNPWDHMDGYEDYASEIALTNSSAQANALKRRIDGNKQARDRIAQGEWGLVAGLIGGLGEPTNYIPVPGAMGVGFVRGAVRGAASNFAITAATEPLRIGMADPTAEWSEMEYSLGIATLLGAGLGGAAGSLKFRGVRAAEARAALERLGAELNEIEGQNIARSFDAAGQGYERVFGRNNLVEADGTYNPVGIEDVSVPVREREGADGQMYFYDDQRGWMLEADRGSPEPRPVSQDILDTLGSPEMTTQRRITVDDTTLKYDFEQGKWVEDKPNGRKGIERDRIKNDQEYLTFRQIEAVWRKVLPRIDGETDVAFANRVQNEALKELDGRRLSASVARAKNIEAILGATNRSLVAKSIRLFKNDNILTDLPLALAGDFGWKIRSNMDGISTPASVYLRQIQHTPRFVEIKQALDAAWLKYVRGSQDAKGSMLLGQNMSATGYRFRNSIQRAAGNRVLTFADFSKMAGRAVFDADDFEVNGFKVVPEAREAAKAFTKVAQLYDREARELGLFYDQKSLTRTKLKSEQQIVGLKHRMAQFLWGKSGEPKQLNAAVLVNEQMFTGKTHEEAVRAAVDVFGPNVVIEPASYGYVREGTKVPAPIPPVKPGYTRLYRGEAPGEAGIYSTPMTGRWFSLDLEDARDFAKSQREGVVYYVDVGPDELGKLASSHVNPERWFVVDKDIANRKTYFDGRDPLDDNPYGTPKARFQTMDDVIASRKDGLTGKQLEVYEMMEMDLLDLTLRRDAAEKQLSQMTEQPHVFRDQFGQPEPYWARFYNKPQIIAERERFARLVTAWYSKDNPFGARERAEATIDRMTTAVENADEMGSMVGGLRHLHQRTLDIPNSFKIQDEQFGTISMADFIETDIEAVADLYVRRMGSRIEMARMFGDTDLWAKRIEIKNHFYEKYILPAAEKGEDLGPIREQMDEYLGNIDLIRDDMLGQLKTRDPWALDNRIARFMQTTASLAMMGRVLFTALPEAMRPAMVNGFGTAFRGTFLRAFGDFEAIKGNVQLNKLTGEALDMVMNRAFARISENNAADVRGGTWLENALEKALPGFYKLVGLSPWTAASKDLSMFLSQHRIMTDILKVTDAMKKGEAVDDSIVSNLAALGISKSDAVMIGQMPINRVEGGEMILPGVDKWTGYEGRRARQLFLDAMIGEVRRTIITPGPADLPMLSRGVLVVKGKKVAESDLMSMPFQFLSYGMAASQKLLLSSLQGRDANAVSGALAMMVMGALTVYLKTPTNAWRNKEYGDILLEAYEAAGLGGFWFSDLNNQIELFSRNQLGLRPMLGLDPRYGKQGEAGDYVDAAGRGLGMWWDVGRAFLDDDLSMTNRAQMIRRAVPFNNVIWWSGITRDLASGVGNALD